MENATMRQLRGLVLAWRRRPERLRRPPISRIDNHGRRYNNYRRFGGSTSLTLIRSADRAKVAYAKLGGRCGWCRQPLDQIVPAGVRGTRIDVVAYWAATGNQSALGGRLSCLPISTGARASSAMRGVRWPRRAGTGPSGCAVRCVGVWRRTADALSLGNLQWLCHDCHAAKT